MAITSGGGKRDSDWGPDFNSLGSVLFLKLDYEYMGVCSIILYTCLYVWIFYTFKTIDIWVSYVVSIRVNQ